jgi:hypothetical protein
MNVLRPLQNPVLDVRGDAAFSVDHRYRYWLARRWDDELPQFGYVLLNPSKAGVVDDGDRTVPKLIKITAANGGGGFELVNLFALMDTHQASLHLPLAVGETSDTNDAWIRQIADRAEPLVLGWGDGNADGADSRGRQAAVRRRARAIWPLLGHRRLWCCRMIGSGAPGHPGRMGNTSAIGRYLPPPDYP